MCMPGWPPLVTEDLPAASARGTGATDAWPVLCARVDAAPTKVKAGRAMPLVPPPARMVRVGMAERTKLAPVPPAPLPPLPALAADVGV